jgi:dTDP-4-dehydro-6-deoxy-alpha-D-glucopyranose 2,3-dehydratase
MCDNKLITFKDTVEHYKFFLKNHGISHNLIENEITVERIKDWNLSNKIPGILEWLKNCQLNCGMEISEIPLNQLHSWGDIKNGHSIGHESNDFFEIIGVRIKTSKTREVASGWDQPFVKQVDLKGGILGLLRKKIADIPHYLVEAKAEPGNPNLVQLSPTLQATFSNIRQSHGGAKPLFSDFFEGHLDTRIGSDLLFKQWLPEDGGRLYLKSNLGMVINAPLDFDIDISKYETFRWVTLHDILYMIKNTNWVNPHIRSLVCAL